MAMTRMLSCTSNIYVFLAQGSWLGRGHKLVVVGDVDCSGDRGLQGSLWLGRTYRGCAMAENNKDEGRVCCRNKGGFATKEGPSSCKEAYVSKIGDVTLPKIKTLRFVNQDLEAMKERLNLLVRHRRLKKEKKLKLLSRQLQCGIDYWPTDLLYHVFD
ncbi:hypothetical protein ACFE04_021929 [Oxalis oulophora]